MPEPEVNALSGAQGSDGYFKHGDPGVPNTYVTTPLPASDAVPTWNKLTPEDIESMDDPVRVTCVAARTTYSGRPTYWLGRSTSFVKPRCAFLTLSRTVLWEVGCGGCAARVGRPFNSGHGVGNV